ncbi:cation diffusion facilitator family transporter [Eubacteriales bacterium OttesenSCG-928-A19]|nr:cation diffusion facilitator family transporter [Eubacteriales bacterium OttesenSCG-928-A19]
MDMRSKEQIAMRVSVVTLIINTLLALFKLLAGILGHSSAMVSDAIHTFSDGVSTIIVMIGIRVSCREPDHRHQYGYERYECVAAILLAGMLGIAGFSIGYSGLQAVMNMQAHTIAIPTLLPLIAALVSMGAKEGMYWYTITAAKRIESGALRADAWHHRSDAISSIGSFVGILGARLGFPILDPLASIFISLFILKTAYDVFMDAIRKMTDTAADEDTVNAIRGIVLSHPKVLGIDALYTRVFADRIFVDADVFASPDTSLHAAAEISQSLCTRMCEDVPSIKRGHIHVLPDRQGIPVSE